MKLVAGLGNPGRKYENTRHNVGFRVADELARRARIELGRERFNGQVGDAEWHGERVVLLKPLTYMNLSGRSVREALAFYKLELSSLLVVVDDMALPPGRLRLRPGGSPGGHNGLASITEALGDDAFARLRIGIGNVEGRRMVGHVLGAFSADEQEEITVAIQRAADAVEHWLEHGIESAMNEFNRPDP